MRDASQLDLHDALFDAAVNLMQPRIADAYRTNRFGVARDDVPADEVADMQRASDLVERVLAINPGNWRALALLGTGWVAGGNFTEAYRSYKRAIAIEPNDIGLLRQLAGTCFELAYHEEALQFALQALSLAPENPDLMANVALGLLRNGRADEAEQMVLRAFSLDQSDQVTLNVLSAVLEYQGRL